jgi:hypothetical protein
MFISAPLIGNLSSNDIAFCSIMVLSSTCHAYHTDKHQLIKTNLSGEQLDIFNVDLFYSKYVTQLFSEVTDCQVIQFILQH